MRRVVVAGQGYVGLPIAMRSVEVGHWVVGYEPDASRTKRLLSASSYIEDVSDGQLTAAMATGRYLPSTDLSVCEGFDVAVITVPTPLTDGAPDLSFVEQSARDLAPFVRSRSTVILESTTYPGTTEELLVPLLEAGSGLRAGRDFFVGYSPERIDPGNRTWTFRSTPKVVSGIDKRSTDKVEAFYLELVDSTVRVSGPKVAELTKLLENTFRHVNIALVNELAMFADELDVDVWEAIDAASTKPFGFMPFFPGPGVGGHCLPVDPSYLSWRVKQTLGSPFRFVELANDINDHMPDYVAQRVAVALNRDAKAIRGSRILVLGLSYKRNSGDIRVSPIPVLCSRLSALGAQVSAADPLVERGMFPAEIRSVTLSESEIAGADLVVVGTDHDSFDWQLVRRTARRILDTRHRMPKAESVEHL
ncbi:nucleotide sugar dehydrogenase [Acidiferrimicrobium sp. IK]|uniref:nucleotide sugar dehydrogenase n=1 Tax=Acidiferrimicrobium sp. IK TaxID=2871700 RepID=UPI0039674798